MIRFLTWLITRPITALVHFNARIKYRREYKRTERTCTKLARTSKEDLVGLMNVVDPDKVYKKFQESLTLRDRFEIWRMKMAIRVANHIHKRSWKKVERELNRDSQ